MAAPRKFTRPNGIVEVTSDPARIVNYTAYGWPSEPVEVEPEVEPEAEVEVVPVVVEPVVEPVVVDTVKDAADKAAPKRPGARKPADA
ncbi:hypothetical protein SEA_CAFASSO_14 [Gordonia phage Cafasso]|uniref:Uncharacterized protein n=1 Tax=Gordonia phage Cafasso TaxID=2851095 RepID=A0AAE7SJZ0_9CAUD|nr:hypothetical protein SEA_CAFASSO_14 [Gordonia phage Cafasso]